MLPELQKGSLLIWGDFDRFGQVIDQVREKIKSRKALVVILDFTAVPAIDAAWFSAL